MDKDPGLTGNLLVERLVGAHIDLVTKEEYAKVGSVVCSPLVKLLFQSGIGYLSSYIQLSWLCVPINCENITRSANLKYKKHILLNI